jgi:hypothetical protein
MAGHREREPDEPVGILLDGQRLQIAVDRGHFGVLSSVSLA